MKHCVLVFIGTFFLSLFISYELYTQFKVDVAPPVLGIAFMVLYFGVKELINKK